MKISVYITSYNQKALLSEAIDSVLGQTRPADEILVVDDASTDGSQAVICAYENRYPGRIRAVLHDRNRGVSATRNDAIMAATGTHITYVDGDDRFLPEKLASEAAVIERDPMVGMVYSNYYDVDVAGQRLGTWIDAVDPPEGELFEAVFGRTLPKRDVFRFELIERQALIRAGLYDLALTIYEDFDLRIRTLKGLKAACVTTPLSERRRHAGGLSDALAPVHLRAIRYIYRKNRHLLDDRMPRVRRRVRRQLFGWAATLAHNAAYQELTDTAHGPAARRLRATRALLTCCRYAPGLVTLGDLYRLLLPARWADRLIDGN